MGSPEFNRSPHGSGYFGSGVLAPRRVVSMQVPAPGSARGEHHGKSPPPPPAELGPPVEPTGDAYMAWVAVGGALDRSAGVSLRALREHFKGLALQYQPASAADDQPRRRRSSVVSEEDEREVSWEEFAGLLRATDGCGGLTADDIAGREPKPRCHEWTAAQRPMSTGALSGVTPSGRLPRKKSKVPNARPPTQSSASSAEPQSEAAGGRPDRDPVMERLRISAMRGKGRHRHIHPDESLSAAERVKEAVARSRSHDELMRLFSPEVRLALSAASARRAIGGPLATADTDSHWFSSDEVRAESRQRLWRGVSPIGLANKGTSAGVSGLCLAESDEMRSVTLPYRGVSPSPFQRSSPDPAELPRSATSSPRAMSPMAGGSPIASPHRRFERPVRTPTPGAVSTAAVAEHGPVVRRIASLPDPYPEVRRFLARKATARQAELAVREGTHAPQLSLLHPSMSGMYQQSALRLQQNVPPPVGFRRRRRKQDGRRHQRGWVGCVGGVRTGSAPLTREPTSKRAAVPPLRKSDRRLPLGAVGHFGTSRPLWQSSSSPLRAATASPFPRMPSRPEPWELFPSDNSA
eukprot:TRINITY_DN18954_c0_g1_i1.p1 TRINITY_DN18954_c0_g1~~TRINITY_DN18954_c0_g1_i1.p1  ORF type:complete len:610 (+),score=94.97 TRINITY_DN18954_c0_g1_i1:94-1830(+)